MKEDGSDIFHHLITDKGFLEWVKKPNDHNNYFWRKWMEEHPENISDVKKAREFIERLHFRKKQLSPNELDDLLGKVIANEVPVYRPVARKPNPGLWPFFEQWFRVAAILLISVMAAFFLNGILKEVQEEPAGVQVEWVTLENPKGRKSKVTLPDGTKVNLNYESRIKFPEAFTGDRRKVELMGEAFFEVVPNDTTPFIVQTNAIETEVLGTSFNIKSFEGEKETEVSLVTGKVKVTHPQGGAEIKKITHLSPGDRLTYNRHSGEGVKGTFDVEKTISWKEGVILFKDAGFEEFIDQLERWYGVDFQIYGSPSGKWKVNGRYQNEKLDDILTGLNFVYDMEYKIQGKNVILKIE